MALGRFIIVCLAVLALGLGACGRKGALQAPPGAQDPQARNAPQHEQKPEEQKSFLLDFLIQ